MDTFSPHSGRGYGPLVLEHYENPRNVGELENPDAVALVESRAHGDRLLLTLRIDDGVISDARFKAFGCGAAIASSSMATVMLQGRRLEEADRLTRREVAEALGGLPESKIHCSVLAEEAIQAALADYGRRQSTQSATGRSRPKEE